MSRLTLHRVTIHRILVKKELRVNTFRLPNTYVASVVVAPAKSDEWSIVERKISAKFSEKYGREFPTSRISCATREIRLTGEDRKQNQGAICGEARSGQSRNAYQTQLKSDDTVPVTAPPPPIKTTRARVSPRNSGVQFCVFGALPLRVIPAYGTECLMWITIDPVHRKDDHGPMIAL